MKNIYAIILGCLLCLVVTGCNNVVNMDEVLESPDKTVCDFEVVDSNFYGAVLVDKNTNVMYYWITSTSGGITPIYNEDGTLKLYEEDDK